VRILVVDDNEAAGRAVASGLSEEGYETALVSLGRQVPGMIQQFKPDVLILDLNLPDLNGAMVARLIREDWPDLRIVFARGSIDPEELPLPPNTEFLLKPYSIEALVQTIQRSASSDL
jgi:CheY-like chemotaxis protein